MDISRNEKLDTRKASDISSIGSNTVINVEKMPDTRDTTKKTQGNYDDDDSARELVCD